MIIYPNMLISIILFICEILFGILIFDFFDPEKKLNVWEKILFSFCLGFLFSNYLILCFALTTSSLTISIIIYFIAFFLILGFRFRNLLLFLSKIKVNIKKQNWRLRDNFWIFPVLIVVSTYIYYLWNLVFKGKDGNLFGFLSGWGDNGFHISLIQRFANANPFNLDNPLLAGTKITYHFLFDFSSAVFYSLNNNLLFSYRIPLTLFGIILFFFLFLLAFRIFKSKILAFTSILLIFFGSGLGFIFALNDIKTAVLKKGITGVFSFFDKIPYEYTTIRLDADVGGKFEVFRNIDWLVPVVSFLSHQRAFLLGTTCFILILTVIILYGKSKNFWRFGIIAGLLPLAHIHTFFALFLIMAVIFWFYLKNYKAWIKFALLTALISLPQIIYLKTVNNSNSNFFLKPFFGWMACSHTASWFFCDKNAYRDNILFFWFKNFGFIFIAWILLLILIAIYKFYKIGFLSKISFDYKFMIASAVLFIVPNVFLFQPWNYDNNKVLFYWQFLAVMFCLIPLIQFFWQKNIIFKTFIVIFIFLSIFSGILDFSIKAFTIKNNSYAYNYTSEDIEMASWIRENTPSNSLFLTTSWVNPVPIFLVGRKIYLGYPGWLWTEGLDYYKNQLKGEKILAGNMQLACDEKIDYILLDKALKDSYNTIDEKYVLDNTTAIYSETTPFETRKILKPICKN